MTLKHLRIFPAVVALSQIFLLSACANVPYYAQAISGHFHVIHHTRTIETVLANPTVDPNIKQALNKVIQIRQFASRELKLPDNLSYTSYADLGRPFVVWNVFAAPEFSVTPKRWCFLQIGCVSYRGFFSQTQAEQYAESLRNEGYDVYVGGVRAYSTLGWFSDPVLNTFIGSSEMSLARLIFHELAHQVVYVAGDTVFNESFATMVEQEGIKRWFAANGTMLQQTELHAKQEREVLFVDLIARYRKRLYELYQLDVDDTQKRAEKQLIFRELRVEFFHLKTIRPDFENYDKWFAQSLNNATLSTVSIYTQLIPAFQAILAQHDQDMETFFNAVIKISKLSKGERTLLLQRAMEKYRHWKTAE